MFTIKHINAKLTAANINAKLVKGDGNFHFEGADVEHCVTTSVDVARLGLLTVDQWLDIATSLSAESARAAAQMAEADSALTTKYPKGITKTVPPKYSTANGSVWGHCLIRLTDGTTLTGDVDTRFGTWFYFYVDGVCRKGRRSAFVVTYDDDAQAPCYDLSKPLVAA